MESYRTALAKEIEALTPEICALGDAIWDAPETAFAEHTAAALQCALLRKLGFTVTEGLAGISTAFSGRYGRGKPVIGILGEFDALPGLSQQACQTEKIPVTPGAPGHGCGHNLLGSGSLAAAAAVRKYLEESGQEGTVCVSDSQGSMPSDR